MSENDTGTGRREKLKEIVKELHEGSDIEAVRRDFAELISDVSPQEIAEMEQSLIAEGVPVEQVQRLCDVHVSVFEDALARRSKSKEPPGHPVHTYIEENKAARRIVNKLGRLIRRVPKGRARKEFEDKLAKLKEIELHYRRKENQLFPHLEKVQFTGPSNVMWGKHDEIRSDLRSLQQAYYAENWSEFRRVGGRLTRAVKRMIFMEEKILFPTALKKLSEHDWAEIRQEEPEIGYAWITPGNLWDASLVAARKASQELGKGSGGSDAPEAYGSAREEPEGPRQGWGEVRAGVPLDVGELNPEQINLMLKSLPVDITYVDEQDRVRYYSQGKERIFPRTPSIIGREVRNCHPPKSVHVVEKILDSFKRKEKSVAEFWIDFQGRFIHIRYFPLYDQSGRYRGVIEVSQDATHLRELRGERRLLDW